MKTEWLLRALEESRARGFLGPIPLEQQIEHALGFQAAWNDVSSEAPSEFLDLGSGGGLPGLVLLQEWGCTGSFVDSMVKRTAFLREVLSWEDAPTGGQVFLGRAEELGRTRGLQESTQLVTARSFGPPAVTAECATRFMKVGGYLIVSEPPTDEAPSRWKVDALGQLGLHVVERVRHGAAYQILKKVRPTPERFPREIGVPGKSPLF
jgi:16S rRNA (guanine527-N7)-methyltransferase